MHGQQNELSLARVMVGCAGLVYTVISDSGKLSDHHAVNALEASVWGSVLITGKSIKCGKDFLLSRLVIPKWNWIEYHGRTPQHLCSRGPKWCKGYLAGTVQSDVPGRYATQEDPASRQRGVQAAHCLRVPHSHHLSNDNEWCSCQNVTQTCELEQPKGIWAMTFSLIRFFSCEPHDILVA